MKRRNIVRELKPKVEPKKDEEKQEKSFDEDEVFKTKNEESEVLPVSVETSQQPVETVIKQPPKRKKVFPKEMCGCGKEVSLNMKHLHVKQKHHMSWLESQKEKPDTQNVETEKMEVFVPQESETQVEENKPVAKQTVSVANPTNFAFDYDKIIQGVSDRYIKYKEEKKKVKEQNDYKTRYEKLLEEQNKKQKQQEARSYLQHQNAVFGRQRKKNANGWFN